MYSRDQAMQPSSYNGGPRPRSTSSEDGGGGGGGGGADPRQQQQQQAQRMMLARMQQQQQQEEERMRIQQMASAQRMQMFAQAGPGFNVSGLMQRIGSGQQQDMDGAASEASSGGGGRAPMDGRPFQSPLGQQLMGGMRPGMPPPYGGGGGLGGYPGWEGGGGGGGGRPPPAGVPMPWPRVVPDQATAAMMMRGGNMRYQQHPSGQQDPCGSNDSASSGRRSPQQGSTPNSSSAYQTQASSPPTESRLGALDHRARGTVPPFPSNRQMAPGMTSSGLLRRLQYQPQEPDDPKYLERLKTPIPLQSTSSRSLSAWLPAESDLRWPVESAVRTVEIPRVAMAKFILAVLRQCLIKEAICGSRGGTTGRRAIINTSITPPLEYYRQAPLRPSVRCYPASESRALTELNKLANSLSPSSAIESAGPTLGPCLGGEDELADLRFVTFGIFSNQQSTLYLTSGEEKQQRQGGSYFLRNGGEMEDDDYFAGGRGGSDELQPPVGGNGGMRAKTDAWGFVNHSLQNLVNQDSQGNDCGGILRPRVEQLPATLAIDLAITVSVAFKVFVRSLVLKAQQVAEMSVKDGSSAAKPEIYLKHVLAAYRLLLQKKV